MPKLTFLDTQESVDVPEGTSVLEYCLSHETPLRFGCGSGVCGVCCVVLAQGVGNVEPADQAERDTIERSTDAAGVRLACRLVMQGDIAVRQRDL